jgi:hypothetical protein
MDVWLTEDAVGREVYGIFTSMDKCKEICQEKAEEFFGKRTTRPLNWSGGRDYDTAYHEDPGGRYLFVITRYAVDEKKEY